MKHTLEINETTQQQTQDSSTAANMEFEEI